MKIRIHEDAEQELLEAAQWYEHRRCGLGSEFLASADEILQRLRSGIGAAPQYELTPEFPEIRRIVLTRFPYVIVFESTDEGPLVLAISHARQEPKYWLHRRGQ